MFFREAEEEGGEADLADKGKEERAAELEKAFTPLKDEFELVARIGKVWFWGRRWEYIGLTFWSDEDDDAPPSGLTRKSRDTVSYFSMEHYH